MSFVNALVSRRIVGICVDGRNNLNIPMTYKSSLLLAGITAVGALAPPSVMAAPPTYTAGDIFMGFRASAEPGATAVYVVNIGSAASYRDATSTITPNLGSINADLVALYGPDWQTRSDLQWGIAGTPSNTSVTAVNGDTTPTLYGSKLLATVGSPGIGWTIAGSSIRGTIATTISTFYSHFTDYQQSVNSSVAVIQGDGDTFSWRKFMAAGGNASYTSGSQDFGGFSNIEATPSQKLSLFRVTTKDPGTYEGYFAISASGVLSFTPPASGTSYSTWATANANGDAANVDTDNNGIANGIQWFTGLTVNPTIVSGSITWPRVSGNAIPSSAYVQTSTDLVAWTNQGANQASGSGSITYTLPTDQSKIFVRLSVNP